MNLDLILGAGAGVILGVILALICIDVNKEKKNREQLNEKKRNDLYERIKRLEHKAIDAFLDHQNLQQRLEKLEGKRR